jgi:hypothetical protein
MGEKLTEYEHTFSSPINTSWGFPEFIKRKKLENIKEGEKICVKVEINILKAEKEKIKQYVKEREKHISRLTKEVFIPFRKTRRSESDNFEAFGLRLFFIYFFIYFDLF